MYLLIALPRGLRTSVVVLEGDYVEASRKFVSGVIPQKITYYKDRAEDGTETVPTKER